MSTLLANPAKMIERGAPRLIRSDEELAQYTEALFKLTALDTPSAAEVEAIELLTLLIERYEAARFPVPEADPVTVVKFLLEQQGLSQRDLVKEFGTESAVSMFLARKRKITLKQVRGLSARFHLPADVFLN